VPCPTPSALDTLVFRLVPYCFLVMVTTLRGRPCPPSTNLEGVGWRVRFHPVVLSIGSQTVTGKRRLPGYFVSIPSISS
jgi:hypothetical protein